MNRICAFRRNHFSLRGEGGVTSSRQIRQGMPGHPARHSLSLVTGDQPRRPQTGHAPMPCECSTFSATRICSSRLAPFGEPEPPLARQVLDVNCRPPEKPLPVLMPQLPPDSHCAIASQFTLYDRWTGGGASAGGAASGPGAPGAGGASKPARAGAGGSAAGAPGAGGTFGSKPTGAGAGATSAGAPGAGGTSGTDPAEETFGATFGSRPIVSALAVAVGTVTSAPVIAASMSVVRTFFNYVPFAVRARQSNPQLWVDIPCSTGPDRIGFEVVLWGVPSRSGTTAGGVLPDGLVPACAAAVAVRSPAHTRFRGLNFSLLSVARFGLHRDRTREERIRHIHKQHISVQ